MHSFMEVFWKYAQFHKKKIHGLRLPNTPEFHCAYTGPYISPVCYVIVN